MIDIVKFLATVCSSLKQETAQLVIATLVLMCFAGESLDPELRKWLIALVGVYVVGEKIRSTIRPSRPENARTRKKEAK